jgi:prepilin-type processing-associated H-X9-DG protein
VYSHLLPPNAAPINTYASNTFRCSEGDSGMNPTSNHPGGVNIAFLDGSVHFIKNTISLPTWWALGTRGRGEIISGDSY